MGEIENVGDGNVKVQLDASCRRKRRGSRRRRSRRRNPCRKFRGGKKTRNAFLNFLRAYRRKCCGKNVKQIAKAGARLWNSMTMRDKRPYFRMACKVPKRKRSKCGRRRPKCPRKSRPCPKKRSKSRRRKSSKKRC